MRQSDEEWCDDVDDRGSACSFDMSDEDWNSEDEDSYDESADFFPCLSSKKLEKNAEEGKHDALLCREILVSELFEIKERTVERGKIWDEIAN